MPTLNATVFPDRAYVLVETDWTDMPQVTHARVVRRNTVTGEQVTLRPYVSFDGDGNLLLTCGMGLWWDTEPPLDVELEYCTLAADTPVELTVNCCFEASTVPWTTAGFGGGINISQDCTEAKEGSCSARLSVNSGTPYSLAITQFPAASFVAGVPVVFSTWIRVEKGIVTPYAPNVYLEFVSTLDDGTQETLRTQSEILDYNEWRFFRVEHTPTRDGTLDQVLAYGINGLPAAGVDFFFDIIAATQAAPVIATACDTVTVPGGGNVWLKSPLNPCSDIVIGDCVPGLEDCGEDPRVSYVGTSDETRSPNSVLLMPVNRKRPIAINRQRRDVAATLRLLAHDCDARDAVITANDPGDPLLFQAPPDYCIPDRYISVGDVTESRISVDQREDFRLMTLPYVVVDRPEGPANGICGARIEDLCDIYTSWSAMNIAGLTWRDLLLGNASDEGPGPTPVPAARTWDDVNAEFADWDAVEAGGTRTWDELRDGL